MRNLVLPVLLLSACGAGCAHQLAESPRSYRYRCDMLNYDAQGKFQNKLRIEADHVRGLPEDRMRWNRASIAFGKSLEGEFGPPMKQSYMEGFTYPRPEIQEMLKPEFYEGFPSNPLAFLMRNSIVDAHMFDVFAAELEHMKRNEPYRSAASDSDIELGGQGNQKLKNLTLTWIGDLRRNGRSCSVILYQSSVDPVRVEIPGARWSGSTVFWGEIWLSRRDRTIEYATLREHALMGPPDPDAKVKGLQNAYRSVTFERVVEEK